MKKKQRNRALKRVDFYSLKEIEKATVKPAHISKVCWAQWSLRQQAHFNKVFEDIWLSRQHFCHPKTPPMDDKQFGTIAHNAAWVAAEMLD